jgi:hypothetical protein
VNGSLRFAADVDRRRGQIDRGRPAQGRPLRFQGFQPLARRIQALVLR